MATTARSPEYPAVYRFWCETADLPEIQGIVSRYGLRFVNNPQTKWERTYVEVGGDRMNRFRAGTEDIREVLERKNAKPEKPKGWIRRMADELYRRGWLA
jgi:hypothetical protein